MLDYVVLLKVKTYEPITQAQPQIHDSILTEYRKLHKTKSQYREETIYTHYTVIHIRDT